MTAPLMPGHSTPLDSSRKSVAKSNQKFLAANDANYAAKNFWFRLFYWC